MKSLLLTAGLALISSALADLLPENLKAFTSVCVNAGYNEGGTTNDDVSGIIADTMFSKLDKAGITVNDSPCQSKGLLSTKQLNVFFVFYIGQDGDVYSAELDGWLTEDGSFENVDLWTSGRFGALAKGTGQAKALSMLDDTLSDFIADWQTAHPK